MAPTPSFVSIIGSGLLTPLGNTPELVLAAIHGGVSAYAASSYCNRLQQPMTTTQVPEGALAPISAELAATKLPSRWLRLARLALPALKNAMAGHTIAQGIPLFLAGPEPLPNMANPVSGHLIQHLLQAQAQPLPITQNKCRYFASGRTGLLEAIDLAFQCFEQTSENYILVGAVDTFIDAATLGQLDAEERVLAEHTADGFAPGEGAGFLLLCRPGLVPAPTHAIYRPGLAVEPGHRYSNAPMLGQGLDSAIKQALAYAPPQTITDIFSSMNGESLFAKEFGVAMIRNSARISAAAQHHHPVDALGDMGAATAAVLITLALNKVAAAQSGSQLVFASSDMGARAAMCIARPQPHTH